MFLTLTAEEERVRGLLMGSVERFRFFSDPGKFYCHRVEDGFCAGYSGRFSEDDALLALQQAGTICYLLSIQIPEHLRGQGHGRELYAAVERFASQMGCDRVRMTPSGWATKDKTRREYMLRLGYSRVGTSEVEKVIGAACPEAV